MTDKKDITKSPENNVRISSSIIKGQRLDSSTVKFFNKNLSYNSQGNNIYVLCDTSRSMRGNRIARLKETVEKLFNRPNLSFVEFGVDPIRRIESAKNITTQANTLMWAGLNFCYKNLANRIVLLTDGCPTDARAEQILERVSTSFTHIPIDTIGIGGDEKSWGYDADFLRTLAQITGGTFCEVKDFELNKLLATTEKLLQIGYTNKGVITL
mgnify:CR=1 FL=1